MSPAKLRKECKKYHQGIGSFDEDGYAHNDNGNETTDDVLDYDEPDSARSLHVSVKILILLKHVIIYEVYLIQGRYLCCCSLI